MSTVIELRQKRAGLIKEAREILTKADKEKRELTSAENGRYEAIMASAEALQQRYEKMEREDVLRGLEDDLDQPLGTPIAQRMDPNDHGSYETRQSSEGEVRLLKPTDCLSDIVSRETPGGIPVDELDLGRMVKGIVSRDWTGADAEKRAMSEGNATAGGYTVPDALATRVIDYARAKSVCFRAGAQTIPMDTSTLSVAVNTADPAVSWKAENAQATATDFTFGRRTLTAKTMYLLIKCSQELWDDTDILGGYVQDTVSTLMANELDRTILRGQQNGNAIEPVGIRGWTFESGASIVTTELGSGDGTTSFGFDDLHDWVYDVEVNNSVGADQMSLVAHPRTRYRFNVLKDGNGQYIMPTVPIKGLKWFNTTQVPINLTVGNSTDCSEIYLGDFSQVWVGVRNNIVLDISNEVGDTYRDNQVWIRAAARYDVTLAHPNHLHVLTGVR